MSVFYVVKKVKINTKKELYNRITPKVLTP